MYSPAANSLVVAHLEHFPGIMPGDLARAEFAQGNRFDPVGQHARIQAQPCRGFLNCLARPFRRADYREIFLRARQFVQLQQIHALHQTGHGRQRNGRLIFQHHARAHPAHRVPRRTIASIARGKKHADVAFGIRRNLQPQFLLRGHRIDRVHPRIRPAFASNLAHGPKTPQALLPRRHISGNACCRVRLVRP